MSSKWGGIQQACVNSLGCHDLTFIENQQAFMQDCFTKDFFRVKDLSRTYQDQGCSCNVEIPFASMSSNMEGIKQVRLLFFSVDTVLKPHFHLVGTLQQ
jgi:hypothetical protein